MQAPNREVILGVGGGIAAYKSCELLRRLRDRGFNVTVVPTPASLNFVGAATWEALSGRSVTSEVFESVSEVRHVSLAKLAQYIIIAPTTADLIARLAHGRADDLLTNVILASSVPTLIVPAMHPQMWLNGATQNNVRVLRERGYRVMEPAVGALTSGDYGRGRFPETIEIIDTFEELIGQQKDLRGRKILVTAGGTREPIDPVRFIGNRSSGKQGFAIARAAQLRGADVTLIAANTHLADIPGVKIVRVETANEMLRELKVHFAWCDALFMAAAVADARPIAAADQKIKKENFGSITLEENPDLLASISHFKERQLICAFAAETNSDLESARLKMARKGADMIFLNDVSRGQIFDSEMTKGFILDRDGSAIEITDISKDTLAHQLLTHALNKLG